MQDAQELDHGDRRVRVVELDGDLRRQLGERLAGALEAADDVAQRAGDEEYCWMRRSSLPASVLSFG